MRLLVIGAGGHAKVVTRAALESGWEIAGIVDESGARTEILGLPVSSGVSGVQADAFIVAIGDNRLRAERFAHYLAEGRTPATVIHPHASIDPTATIGAGTVVLAGAVVTAEARIGDNVILNTNCSVDHECVVGPHVHVAPGVSLSGAVTVGEGTLIGIGSCAIPLSRIGAWAIVGAGSAVTEPVPDGATVAGSPARMLDRLLEEVTDQN